MDVNQPNEADVKYTHRISVLLCCCSRVPVLLMLRLSSWQR